MNVRTIRDSIYMFPSEKVNMYKVHGVMGFAGTSKVRLEVDGNEYTGFGKTQSEALANAESLWRDKENSLDESVHNRKVGAHPSLAAPYEMGSIRRSDR